MSTLLSLTLFGEGFLTGVMLTLMLGPVTMTILRYGLQVNRAAGIWAAAGTWVSDFVFIGFTFWITTAIEMWSEQPDVRFSLFLAGGLGLMLMGGLLLKSPRKEFVSREDQVVTGYVRAFSSGFLVNSLSPFTLFFWLGAAVFLHLQEGNPVWYYTGLMLSLGAGDFIKAWIAPSLTRWLKEKHVYWIQVVAGILIAGTGLYIVLFGFFEKSF